MMLSGATLASISLVLILVLTEIGDFSFSWIGKDWGLPTLTLFEVVRVDISIITFSSSLINDNNRCIGGRRFLVLGAVGTLFNKLDWQEAQVLNTVAWSGVWQLKSVVFETKLVWQDTSDVVEGGLSWGMELVWQGIDLRDEKGDDLTSFKMLTRSLPDG